jgi:hypothetical protein
VVTEVDEDGNGVEDDVDGAEDAPDSGEDDLQRRFESMAFVVSTHKLEQMPHWVKVTDVFKTDSDTVFLKRAGVSSLDDPRAEKYSRRLARLRAIRKYQYRMDILERNLTYDEVTEIFVRVNSLGAKLRSSDLALAQITARWRGSLQVFQQYQKNCADGGFDLDLGLHLKNLVAFATGQSRFLTVWSLSLPELQAGWQAAVRGMDFALNFVRSNVRLESPVLLSSPFLLITVAIFGHKRNFQLSPDEAVRLRFWVLLANAKGRYTRGSSETLLDQDLAILREGGGAEELIERLRQQVGRLEIAPEELEGRNQRSALFKTMFLAFRDAGARDWRSNLTISLDHAGQQHSLQFHHIFPKALLKGPYSSREADDIANLAFISGRTNRAISDKEPASYLAEIVSKSGSEPFERQCIPLASQNLEVSNYRQFLQERRKAIATRLNSFLSIPILA